MTPVEQSILAALNELDTAARNMSTSPSKPNLLPIFERLESLARQLPPGSNSELAHFLSRKSYDKARLLLLGRNSENARGNCH